MLACLLAHLLTHSLTHSQVWAKKELVSKDCGKFLNELLTRNVNERLGCGPSMKQNFNRIKVGEESKLHFGDLEERSSREYLLTYLLTYLGAD